MPQGGGNVGGSVESFVDWLRTLTVNSGQGAGDRFEPLDWQQEFIGNLLRDDVSTAALSVARGAGKSTLLAAVAAATLADGPLAIPNTESLVVAGTLKQSKEIQKHVEGFLRQRDDWGDRRVWRARRDYAPSFEHIQTGTILSLRAPSADSLQGAQPRLVLADEPAVWGKAKTSDGADVFHVLRSSLGKIPGAKLVALGTQAEHDGHWFSKMLDGVGADYVQLHTADEDDDPFARGTWLKANPSLDFMPAQELAIQGEVDIAKSDANEMSRFRNKRLNQRVSMVDNVLLDPDVWFDRCQGDAEAEGSCIWGLDMGLNDSASAVAAYWPDTGKLSILAAFPRDQRLSEREMKHAASGVFEQAAREGDLILSGQHVVDAGAFLAEALDRFGLPRRIIADNFRAPDVRNALDTMRFPMTEFDVAFEGMRWESSTRRIKACRAAAARGEIHAGQSTLLNHALSETTAERDKHGNEMAGRRHRMSFNDPAVAALLAVSEGVAQQAKPAQTLEWAWA